MPISIQQLKQAAMRTPNTSPSQAPTTRPQIRREQTLGQIIGQYNSYSAKLRRETSMRELAEELMQIAEFAEQAVMSESEDWFDGHTIKRNMKEIKQYVKEFHKIAMESDTLHQRATALYDDMGRVLERYFEIQDDDGSQDAGYDTDGDGLKDLVPGNAPKNPVSPEKASKLQHETDQQNENEQLTERLLRLARHHLKGEQLSRFDTLPRKTQIQAAWRIVK